MADPQAEARIRDLEQRMAAMPGSRIFVGLAEEYRRAGRFGDALATLRTGLEAHPSYLSARIAVARLYQEMGRDDEAIDAFARVLAADRENLVAAKALGDLYARRGNAVEAVKKYKLYRALASDRTIDEKIAVLEREAKSEVMPPAAPPPPPRPPAGEPRMFDPINFSDSSAEFRFSPNATQTLSTLEFSPVEPPPAPDVRSPAERETEDAAADAANAAQPAEAEVLASGPAGSLADITLPGLAAPGAAPETAESGGRAEMVSRESETPLPEAAEAAEETPAAPPEPDRDAMTHETTPSEEPEGPIAPPPDLPPSRTLAELYERQGFREEALRIYERLAAEHPDDEGLTRRIASVREEPGIAPVEDPLARKRRALEAWLARVKGNAAAEGRRP